LFFEQWGFQDAAFGGEVTFLRRLRNGREVGGRFDLLLLDDTVCLVVSALQHDEEANGPGYLVEHAHPLARKPFVGSGALRRLLLQMAEKNAWEALVVKSEGYERVTGEYRLDTKKQPVPDAFEEMREQGREMHQVTVRFRPTGREPGLKAAFSRDGKITVFRGDPVGPIRDFLLYVCELDAQKARTCAIEVSPRPLAQTTVRLAYDAPVFTDREHMEALVRATSKAGGLNVTVVHLNPYLQAQVVDFYSGGTVDMVVMDQSTVSLIPRTRDSQPVLERITKTVFRFFGEAETEQTTVRQGQG
jgi:hypothetical protein